MSSSLELSNDCIVLRIGSDGSGIQVQDRRRDILWRLEPNRQYVRQLGADQRESITRPLERGTCQRMGGDSVRIVYSLGNGDLSILWTLAADHVRVSLEAAPSVLESVALPGSFTCDDGRPDLLLPPYQGVLYRYGLEPWSALLPGGAHGNFSLSMAATIGQRGALLVTQEKLTGQWRASSGQDDGGTYVTFEQERCPVDGWNQREVRLYPVAPDIAAVAFRYRQRIIERDEFVSWQQKIARKPIVASLFGSLMAFTGYNRDPGIDYARCARRLLEIGFQSVLYFPVRMCNYGIDFEMGGDRPVWLSDAQIAAIKAVPGAKVGPWGWFIEGLDDGSQRMASLYRRRQDGTCYNGWRIEEQQWKSVCVGEQIDEVKRRYADDMASMDWMHYDVSATRLGRDICHALDHPSHPGHILDREQDIAMTKRLLSPEINGNRIVSSEGFIDRYAVSYDIGTTKLVAMFPPHSPCIPVPLTSLVLHDSCVHDWWELHNYNEQPGWPMRQNRWGWTGSGMAQLKAAMDALYGAPPSVFPFGRQYAWTDVETRSSFSYAIRLEHREVQKALEVALPVAQLHRRTGMQAMTGFEMLSDDGSVQATSFADGTRVIANLGRHTAEVPQVGIMAPATWRVQ